MRLRYKSAAEHRPGRRTLGVAVLLCLLLGGGAAALFWWRAPRWMIWRVRPPKPFVAVATLEVVGAAGNQAKAFHEPFGIAADEDGDIFVSESVTGRIYRFAAPGSTSKSEPVPIEGLDTPSAMAFDNEGNLIVANTGTHTIIRIDLKNNRASTIAGAEGESGSADGRGAEARFNGPVGVAVGEDGTIFVADTYNDRIRTISRDGQVRTLAGGDRSGFADGLGSEARFDTPCGIAIAEHGVGSGERSLLVADTGNHRIRRVDLNGRVTTIAGTGEPDEFDAAPLEAAFDEPTAIVMKDRDSFYVADAAGSAVRLCQFGQQPFVRTLAGGRPRWFPNGLVDDHLPKARLNRPTGLALLPDGELIFADSGNGLVRAFVPANTQIGRRVDPAAVIIQAPEMRAMVEPRWPFDPPQARRDIAGTFGEIRCEHLHDPDAHFHTGLDIPGVYGEMVRAIYTERVTRPLAVSEPGGPGERLRLPLFEYIHLRIGRDQNDQPLGNFANGAISFDRDQDGRLIRLRVRRGTRINAGDPIGTLNRLNHVHLVAGPVAFEFNALAALNLPSLIDTLPPVIETVTFTNEEHRLIFQTGQQETGRQKKRSKRAKTGKREMESRRVEMGGKVRIAVRAYDQLDGNPRHRRLGLYRLGYQILNSDGSPAADFREPRYNLVFDRLPSDKAVLLAYAEGSQSGHRGITIFDYVVTNIVRHGEAREDFWETTKLAAGDYILRVFAEDYFGNQAIQDIQVTVAR